MCYCITVTDAILGLWLKHRVKHISSRFLPVQQKSPDRPAAPPPLRWLRYLSWFSLRLGPVLCFYSAYFFSVTWATEGLSWKVSDQVRADAAPVWGRGYQQENDWHFSDTPLCSDWLWILADQITATGRSHRQLTCIWFYCHMIMTVLANLTKQKTHIRLIVWVSGRLDLNSDTS